MSRPSVFPDWATTLANDPVTGQPNRAEPSAGKKITGFNFNEKPPRQDVNWLHYTTKQWLEYLDEQITALDKPAILRPGKGQIKYTYSGEKMQYDILGYENPVYTQFGSNFIDASLEAPGVTVFERCFNRPVRFTKLNLSFLARSSIDLSTYAKVGVYVVKQIATADDYVWDTIDSEEFSGTTLFNAPSVRSVQLDLSSMNAGDPIYFIYLASFNSISTPASDFTVDVGQLTSSWGI